MENSEGGREAERLCGRDERNEHSSKSAIQQLWGQK